MNLEDMLGTRDADREEVNKDGFVQRASRLYHSAKAKLTDIAKSSVRLTNVRSSGNDEYFVPLAPFSLLASGYYILANGQGPCYEFIQACAEPEPMFAYKMLAAIVVAGFSVADIVMKSPSLVTNGATGLSFNKPTKEADELSRLKSKYGEFVDKLIAQDIPEELIDDHMDLWDFLKRVDRNEIVSQNDNFKVKDRDGNKWLMKISRDKTRARMEAAANYYLSSQLDFIVPGKHAEPLEANGFYMTMQKDVSDEPVVERSLDYWLGAFAMFHKEAEAILREYGVEVKEVKFRSVDQQVERYLQGCRNNELKLDPVRLEENMDYLANASGKVAIHNDAKKGNRAGRYLVDLESVGRGHPAMDLALLFMQYDVPEEEWDAHLQKYLTIRGVSTTFDADLKELKKGMQHAKHYNACREIIGSSLREVGEDTKEDNIRLAGYAHVLATA